MFKVYLAKSNKANPDHIIAVRTLLSKFNVEVVEYTGGTYDNRPLLDSDLLVVLPEVSQIKTNGHTFTQSVPIGKGLYEQILTFAKHQEDKHNLSPHYADLDDLDNDEDDYDYGHNDGEDDHEFEVSNIYIVSGVNGKEVFTSPFMDLEIINRKDFINHGKVEFDNGSEESFYDELRWHVTNAPSLKSESTSNQSTNNYMYLLTRKK